MQAGGERAALARAASDGDALRVFQTIYVPKSLRIDMRAKQLKSNLAKRVANFI